MQSYSRVHSEDPTSLKFAIKFQPLDTAIPRYSKYMPLTAESLFFLRWYRRLRVKGIGIAHSANNSDRLSSWV